MLKPDLPDHNRLVEERYDKARALRDLGVDPYPHRWVPNTTTADALDAYDDHAASGRSLRIAGRIVLVRVMGKAAFFHLLDGTGRIQVYLKQDVVGEPFFDLFKKLIDLGDIVGVEGPLFITRTGEKTIEAQDMVLLSKALRPPPDKFHGLQDKEQRYRQRYVDLFANPENRAVFRARARLISSLRRQLDARGYLEVETPMMQSIYGGAAARPFVTHHNALDIDLFLRIAPELYLKRLLVGGFEKVYEINRNFRNEGLSLRHNPEFTMLELYTSYWDYHDTMDLTEELIREVVRELGLPNVVPFGDDEVEMLGAEWERLSVLQAIRRETTLALAWDMSRKDVIERAGGWLADLSEEQLAGATTAQLIMEVFAQAVEHTLVQPTFITEFPAELSPLAKAMRHNPHVAERFELYIGRFEVANAYSELNDPARQWQAFVQQLDARRRGDAEAHQMDEDYVRALEYGMPPASGLGIGIDRLTMLLTNQTSIRDVILFPLMRPKGHAAEAATHTTTDDEAGDADAAPGVDGSSAAAATTQAPSVAGRDEALDDAPRAGTGFAPSADDARAF